jgi:hypothetical protein
VKFFEKFLKIILLGSLCAKVQTLIFSSKCGFPLALEKEKFPQMVGNRGYWCKNEDLGSNWTPGKKFHFCAQNAEVPLSQRLRDLYHSRTVGIKKIEFGVVSNDFLQVLSAF